MTTHSLIDFDAATVTRTVQIDAPREVVWAALTTPSQIALWFGQSAEFPDGIHLGATGIFGWGDEGDFPARIETWEPTSRFAFSWGTPGEEIRPDNSTTANFTLADAGTGADAGTLLTVTETGFETLTPEATARRTAMQENAQGWNEELDDLAAHIGRVLAGAAAVPDLVRGTITHTVLIGADAATVWAALTDPAAIEEWWGHPAVFPDGIRPGARGTFEWVDHGLFPILVERREPLTCFEFRWGDLHESEPGPTASRVTFTMAAAGKQTLVTVVEAGFDTLEPAARRAAMEENVGGWNATLDGLRRHVTGVRA
ncbi:MAG: SRPBCC domain-containing protein [Propionibacteriaceae bacterium]